METDNQKRSLGDCIAKLVEDEYRKLSPACKPVTRSNGLREWTVLAGIVAIDKWSKDRRLRLVSIGTGVKALPDSSLQRSHGRMVHDCHAEILALRGFNTVLLEHIHFMEVNQLKDTDLLEKNDNLSYNLKSKWELALYISTLPCGDVSMKDLQSEDLTSQNQDLAYGDNFGMQWVDENVKTIIRGRFDYSRQGIVRTKPGRSDSLITLSKSCSDKLCLKQSTSILNCLTWDLMHSPIFLQYLIIPNVKEDRYDQIYHSFRKRTGDLVQKPFVIIPCSRRFADEKHNADEEPSSMSSVKLFLNLPERSFVEQAILNGLKNGFYTKGSKPLRKNCEPVVSRIAQWKLYATINPNAARQTYLQFKASVTERFKLVQEAKKALSPDGWVNTRSDDCQW